MHFTFRGWAAAEDEIEPRMKSVVGRTASAAAVQIQMGVVRETKLKERAAEKVFIISKEKKGRRSFEWMAGRTLAGVPRSRRLVLLRLWASPPTLEPRSMVERGHNTFFRGQRPRTKTSLVGLRRTNSQQRGRRRRIEREIERERKREREKEREREREREKEKARAQNGETETDRKAGRAGEILPR
jgi:hypothetical protein